MPWLEQIRRQLNEKVNRVNEFRITLEKVKKEISKRKGWTAPGKTEYRTIGGKS